MIATRVPGFSWQWLTRKLAKSSAIWSSWRNEIEAPKLVTAGASPNLRTASSTMAGMFGKASASISAEAPGGYDRVQTRSILPPEASFSFTLSGRMVDV